MRPACCYFMAATATIAAYYLPEVCGQKPYDVRLPEEHMGMFFHNSPEAARSCREEPACPHKHFINAKTCWGYEPGCLPQHRYCLAACPEGSAGWASNKQQQEQLFFNQGDFGFIHERKKTLGILCRPHKPGASLLECVRHMELCRAKNIRLDFQRLLSMTGLVKYREDILGPGLVGGYCRLDKDSLHLEGDHKSPLQSWYAELEHFEEFKELPFEESGCDVILGRPTVIMKLDATVNMYHHFCDFLNLYLTMHFNNSLAGDFDILIWDTLPYKGTFLPMWSAFHSGKLRSLSEFRGKKVCLREALFAFLPRMIFGMYYNLPLVPGCHSSGVFKAFNRHVLHKLDVKVLPPEDYVRVTLLSRGTKHRRILNEDEIMANTDVLIGMHGAGLTHVLFQPDWAVLFEIYNCDDPVCYKDLARLRGVKYLTWENTTKLRPEDEGHHPTLGAHAKFTNYHFNVNEFLRLLGMAIDHVKEARPQAVTDKLSTKGAQPTAGHQEL
ncbi:EGF domain-specific O-linked N-acetylglucosamine transferase-like isoform X2 [Dermacentor andersoni]|uniref:EGF domain-specific O-linked N-acetylglucosamine transferase-like isoform X2 n=1 Tax=Dermacentor andersoni TaxID=34620 RepID=UPI002155A16C|nr:EGF domain-specific O-linked N-acetylglucosamine transferase-like isoform X2 [Dermacentor andersoni]